MEESSERSRSLEINRALHTIDESHLQSFSSMEDGGDPLDRFGLDDFGQAEMIDTYRGANQPGRPQDVDMFIEEGPPDPFDAYQENVAADHFMEFVVNEAQRRMVTPTREGSMPATPRYAGRKRVSDRRHNQALYLMILAQR